MNEKQATKTYLSSERFLKHHILMALGLMIAVPGTLTVLLLVERLEGNSCFFASYRAYIVNLQYVKGIPVAHRLLFHKRRDKSEVTPKSQTNILVKPREGLAV